MHDAKLPHCLDEELEPATETIIGAAIIRFNAVWNPMLSMNEEKRAM